MEESVILEKIEKKEYIRVEKAQTSRSSDVWSRFWMIQTPSNEPTGVVQCRLGHCILRYKSSTTNMRRHKCPSNDKNNDKESAIPEDAKSAVTEACALLCALDMRPFNIVSGEGFIQVAQTLIDIGHKYGSLDARKLLPHRTTVARHITSLSDQTKLEVIPEVRKALAEESCALTTDMWTDDHVKNHYTSLTAHYIDDQWNLKSRALLCAVFPDVSKTGENIMQEVAERTAELGIPLEEVKKGIFVSDQGANIQKGLRDSELESIPCNAHCFNTVLRHTFEEKFLLQNLTEVQECLTISKEVVTFLKQSGLVNRLEKTVLQDVDTRFNSKILMLSSVESSYDSIQTVFQNEVDQLVQNRKGKAPKTLTPVEKAKNKFDKLNRTLISEIISFLKPFKECCDDLEGEKMVTLHKVLLWKFDLLLHCEPQATDTSSIAGLRERAKMFIDCKIVLDNKHKVATFLCPSYSQLLMLSNQEQVETTEALKEIFGSLTTCSTSQEASRSVNLDLASQSSDNPSQPPQKRSRFQRWQNVWQESPSVAVIDSEIERYKLFSLQNPEKDEDVLGWWKSHHKEFPLLSRVARKVLCVPATSAASERVFSCAGWLLNCRRTLLSPDVVNSLVFLRSNLRIKMGLSQVQEKCD